MRSITITERHRQAVMLVAEHGLLDTAQVSVLLGVSRPTAHRLLDALHTAGLLDRPFSGRGRQHRWDYTVTEVGVTVTGGCRRLILPVQASAPIGGANISIH